MIQDQKLQKSIGLYESEWTYFFSKTGFHDFGDFFSTSHIFITANFSYDFTLHVPLNLLLAKFLFGRREKLRLISQLKRLQQRSSADFLFLYCRSFDVIFDVSR